MPKENDTTRQQELRIKAARELLEPTPVRLHHFPLWMKQAMNRVAKARGFTFTRDSIMPLGRFEELLHSLMAPEIRHKNARLDHWGSSRTANEESFVSEPYGMTVEAFAAWELFAELAGLKCCLSPNSYWYPGSTMRIEIVQPRVSKGDGDE